jgi:hypothetical protein
MEVAAPNPDSVCYVIAGLPCFNIENELGETARPHGMFLVEKR